MTTVVVKRDESLSNLMDAFQQSPSDALRQALYRTLAQAVIYVAAPMVPQGWLQSPGKTGSLQALPLMTAVARDGSRGVVAFCDEVSAKQAGTELFVLAVPAPDLILLVLQQGYEALMLKKSDAWIGIPRADLQVLGTTTV
jgi:hypothetical protein